MVELRSEDGQIRTFVLVKENCMICQFANEEEPNEPTGWCWWTFDVDDLKWHVMTTSRGEGVSVANSRFTIFLNEVHLQLLAERELL